MEKVYKIMDGNEACSYVSYNFTEVAGIYPITPSSPMAELTDTWSKNNKMNYFGERVNIVEMQSEAGAAGMIHGSLQSGCLTTTYTASQGLLLMIPNMYKLAGELLPAVIHVAARSLSTHALSILGDHQDIYAVRATGFAILASSSVQQVMDLTGVAHLSAIKGRVPFVNFFDGFRTSHELQKIEVIDTDKLKDLIDIQALNSFRERSLHPDNSVIRGTAEGDDVYFQVTEARNKYYLELEDIVENYMREVSVITGREYKPFQYYGSRVAKRVIIAMGSVCETIRETVDYLNKIGEEVGLIEVHLYRPFSIKKLIRELPTTVLKVAVLDRTKEAGSNEPLYLDVVNAIKGSGLNIEVLGGRYGLSSKNTTPAMIKGVYDFLDNSDRFTSFTVGITDDITNLSIIYNQDFKIPNNNTEFLIYGYGSDGMVSASKDIMKITGAATNAYVQGYFQYDSKKSGGVTKSHLRFSKEPIRSTYYVEAPKLIACTDETYLHKFLMLDTIEDNGIFLLNTSKSGIDILNYLTNHDKGILKKRNIKFFTVDASAIAKEAGLEGKISTIMETIIFKVGKIIDFDYAKEQIRNGINLKFADKSNQVAEKNILVMDTAILSLTEVKVTDLNIGSDEHVNEETIFEIMNSRRGDSLKVSAFITQADGTYESGTSKLEIGSHTDMVPCYNPDNCIMCNQCSFVCPHAVIRPFLLDKEEVEKAPISIKNKLKPANIKGEDYQFIIGTSIPNCTGCTLCESICPGKASKKAITMKSVTSLKEEAADYKYLFTSVSEKQVLSTKTVKGSQFKTPKFEFSGACSGCGETPYLKLLTQLFGDSMVISNATGCSSIYGASAPNMPYSVPWASSLFEDNAEYGYGMKIADNTMKKRITNLIKNNIKSISDSEVLIYTTYLDHIDETSSQELYEIVDHSPIIELRELKPFIKKKSFFIIGGDGWAYDIGFGGIDHILASLENVNIIVLDTEVYSNTGGQASKSSQIGAIAKFTANGKGTNKKDLAKMALTYPHVYVGTVSLGANMQHTLKTFLEAENYDGPSIIIAYAPCIAQGIVKGMKDANNEQKKAVEVGYFPLFHYNPDEGKFYLDSKADFNRYFEFIAGEERYRLLRKINPEHYRDLLEENKNNAIRRYNEYEQLANDNDK
ncbi:MAG: pyruvate:ferredoxin (flavodoxin) oxidoreductase [Bacilli bacterium]